MPDTPDESATFKPFSPKQWENDENIAPLATDFSEGDSQSATRQASEPDRSSTLNSGNHPPSAWQKWSAPQMDASHSLVQEGSRQYTPDGSSTRHSVPFTPLSATPTSSLVTSGSSTIDRSASLTADTHVDSDFVPLWERVTTQETDATLSDDGCDDWESQPFADASESVTVEDVTVPESSAPLLNADEIEAIRKAAELEGYQEGFVKGEDHGRTSGEELAKSEWNEKFLQQQTEQEKLFSEQLSAKQQEVDALIQLVNQLKARIPDAIQHYEQQMHSWMLETVIHLTQAVVAHEVKKGAEHIQQFIAEGLQALPLYDTLEEGKELRIYLNPEDHARCCSLFQESPHQLSDKNWTQILRADPNLSIGDCRIVTPESQVAFCLHERLNEVCNQYLELANDHL